MNRLQKIIGDTLLARIAALDGNEYLSERHKVESDLSDAFLFNLKPPRAQADAAAHAWLEGKAHPVRALLTGASIRRSQVEQIGTYGSVVRSLGFGEPERGVYRFSANV